MARNGRSDGCWNSWAAARFAITVEADSGQPSGLRVKWKEHEKWKDWADLSEGTCVLRSNVADWTPAVRCSALRR